MGRRGNCADVTSLCVRPQKVLSEMQAENQQRLKDREQELKDMKKMMEAVKVGQQNDKHISQKPFR